MQNKRMTEGNLQIHTPLGILTEQCPVSYQPDGRQHLPIATEFTLERQPNGTLEFGFRTGCDYDHRYPIVIDPGLVYSTYLGGSSSDQGFGIAVDASGNAYVTGLTLSTNFPVTPGAFQTSFQGALDAFVTKLNAAGTALIYSTFLGGSSIDVGNSITIDTLGNAYVTGLTFSANFPTTAGAFQTTFQGTTDTFVTKLNADGTALIYSTYLGGSGDDEGFGIKIDKSNKAYVTGITNSPNFPTTPGAFQTAFQGGTFDAFVTKFNADGTGLIYSTYLGGNDDDEGFAITIDDSGNAYVTGQTSSTNFPITPGAFQTAFQGGATDSYVTRFNSDGTGLIYSSYLRGSGDDDGSGIAVDTSSNAYVTGYTDSTNFPTTPGAFQPTFQGNVDAVVSKLQTVTPSTVILRKAQRNASRSEIFTNHPIKAIAGETIEYQLTATNAGLNTVYNLEVTDNLATNLKFIAIISSPIGTITYSGGSFDGTVTFSIPFLANGDTVTAVFSVQVIAEILTPIDNFTTGTFNILPTDPTPYQAIPSNVTVIEIERTILVKLNQSECILAKKVYSQCQQRNCFEKVQTVPPAGYNLTALSYNRGIFRPLHVHRYFSPFVVNTYKVFPIS